MISTSLLKCNARPVGTVRIHNLVIQHLQACYTENEVNVMENNIGVKDKNIRLGAGIVLLILAVVLKAWWMGLIGIIMLGTALIGYCPLYQLLGYHTLNNQLTKK